MNNINTTIEEKKLNKDDAKYPLSPRFELSEQQLIHLEECVSDIEPSIKYLKNTNIGIVNGLMADVSFKLIKEIIKTIRNQPLRNDS